MAIFPHQPVIDHGQAAQESARTVGLRGLVLGVVLCELSSMAHPNVVWADTTIDEQVEVHWSFRRLCLPVPPPTKNSAWVKTPVDAFVLSKLEDRGLRPAGAASRQTLLRRLSFDLLGLPPSAEEVDQFLGDRDPGAYERLVERMLSSPHYGERWGRHWLDVVRYADTGGFEADLLYPRAWRFRDYVIRSLNAGKPFDRFVLEQVAGDELWPNDPEAVLGSNMYSIGPALADSAMVAGQLEYDWLTDCADTTGEALLGMTLGCARCHDHKYDPIRQRDYYAMQAIFAASDRTYPEKIRLNRIKALNGLLSDAPIPKRLLDDPRCTVKDEAREGFRLLRRAEPLVVHLLHRGELNKPQEIIEPALPAALLPGGARAELAHVSSTQRRTVLARWLTSAENPLVARVLANRVWGWHFGQSIVGTPNDFGFQGEEPTHPQLLDYLAKDLIDHGWSLKRLHRLILLSSTYQMVSVATDAAAREDDANLLLSHFPRRRLEGEEIRDAMLTCSGQLNLKQFGKPFVPPLGQEELTGLFDARQKWPVTKDGSEHTRRSVYLLVRRTFTYPMFSSFDPPEVMTSCARRMQTIVPAQALTMLNSPQAREQAAAFATRIIEGNEGAPEKAVSSAWLWAYGRPITKPETERALEFLKERSLMLASSARGDRPADDKAKRDSRRSPCSSPQESALAELCLALFNSNEFIFVD
jgi:hypothetical protein